LSSPLPFLFIRDKPRDSSCSFRDTNTEQFGSEAFSLTKQPPPSIP
jgi:hypothetical protein